MDVSATGRRDESGDTDPSSRRPILVLAVASGALVLLCLCYHWLVSALWILGDLVALGIGVLLAGTMVVAVVTLFRRRTRIAVFAGLWTAAALTGAAFILTNMGVSAAVWFYLHRSDFAEVRELARGGQLGHPEGWDYYGPRLPDHLCDVSSNCQVASIGTSGGQPVLFLPLWMGVPDDAAGFAHFATDPPVTDGGSPFDLFGAPACGPAFELGGGWWWIAPGTGGQLPCSQ